MAGWYRYIRPRVSRAERLRWVRRSPADAERQRKPPRIRNPKYVFYKTYSSAIHINGYRAKVITRWGIAKFFDIPVQTVQKWAKAGVLPEPFMMQERGSFLVPIYLSSQIRCLMIVVTDLVKDGYVSIQWHNLDEHKEMLHMGYAEALRNFKRRMVGTTYDGEGHRGVNFLD